MGANIPVTQAAPPPTVTGPEASDGRYLELLSPPETGFTRSFGVVGFDRTDPGPYQRIVADYDFRRWLLTG